MSLADEYLQLTKKYKQEYGEKTILLMQAGTFMEMYGPDTEIYNVASICDLVVSKKTRIMTGFPDSAIDKYVNKIQSCGYTIIIYLQTKKNASVREFHSIISPGTYINVDMDMNKTTNNMVCIWIKYISHTIINKIPRIEVGFAIIDTYTGQTMISEYMEPYTNIQDICVFNKLETNISRYNPIESIILTNVSTQDLKVIKQYIGLNSIKNHVVDILSNTTAIQNCQNQIYQQELCNKFYNGSCLEYNLPIANQTLCYLLNFIYVHNQSLVNNIKYPTYINTSNTLILETHSLKQLNIIDNGDKSKFSSVLKLLNKCITPMGKRSFEQELLNPINNSVELLKKYDQIETFIKYIKNTSDITTPGAIEALNTKETQENQEIKNNIIQSLTGMYDISKFIRLLHLHNNLPRISPKQLILIYNTIQYSNKLLSIVKPYIVKDLAIFPEFNNTYIETLQSNILELLTIFETILNIEICSNINDCKDFTMNIFKKGINPDLDKCNDTIQDTYTQLEFIRNFLINCIKHDSTKNTTTPDLIKFEYNNNDIPRLSCTRKRFETLKTHLPNKNKQIKLPNDTNITLPSSSITSVSIGKSSSSCVSISNTVIDEFCQKFHNSNQELQIKMNEVYTEFINNLIQQSEKFEYIEKFIIHFDVLYCKAYSAIQYDYCKPNIIQRNKSFIETTGLRHALIEHINEYETYVANDITIGNNITDGILLYGVNMSGKTSLIRSIGIAVIMAQAGLYVPASSFTFYPYQYLFTRILGNDNLFQGLSTFATEMKELRTILNLCNENSLVLGDEICSGTETVSACSIFISSILHLSTTKSTFMFATHLHEILSFDELKTITTVSIKHLDVKYDNIKGILEYNRTIREGPGSNIYGLEVCRSLYMPSGFLENAQHIRNKYFNPLGDNNSDGILGLGISAYNSKKIINICETCKRKMGTEIHHISYQRDANETGYIKKGKSIFHKNALHNLISLCSYCHKDIHKI